MPPLPPPPGSTAQIHAQNALVLAPHFDDEVLGCGGLLLELLAGGAEVRVLFLSDGGHGAHGADGDEPDGDGPDGDGPDGDELDGDGPDGDRPDGDDEEDDRRIAYAERRRAEAERAAEVLGLTEVRHLGLRDGALDQQLGELADGIRRVLGELEPDLLLMPAPSERSADHRAAFAAAARVLADRSLDAAPRVLLYEVNHLLDPDVLVAVEAYLPRLEQAMDCYASQLERHDYWRAGAGRRRFRTHTLPAGVGAAEAYRRLDVSDFTTRSPSALWRHLGAPPERLATDEPTPDGPLVSVIVRTKDRPELLAEALESIAASEYRRLEVVLVNDGGDSPTPPGDFPFPIRGVELRPGRGRAGAANAGLAAASGDYVAFLDDDDRVEPEHYRTLVAVAGAAGVRVAYTDAAVVVHALDGEHGWREVERRLAYSRDFDADLLLFDNYIPFNTLLVERALADEVGELDPELPFFEDWDWLIRLAGLTPFHHLPRVTCEYRQFRGAGHHVLGDDGRGRHDFLEMKARVIGRHGRLVEPERVARVVDTLRAETVAAEEDGRHLRDALEEEQRRYHVLNGALRASEDRRRQLDALGERADLERRQLEARLDERARHLAGFERQVAELHAHQAEQGEQLRAAYAEIARLGEVVEAMESTRAWKMHQKLQGLKG